VPVQQLAEGGGIPGQEIAAELGVGALGRSDQA
jgi:hypothetical protein